MVSILPLTVVSVTGARWWTVGGYHGYHLVAGDKRVLPGGIVAPKPILIIADEFKCG